MIGLLARLIRRHYIIEIVEVDPAPSLALLAVGALPAASSLPPQARRAIETDIALLHAETAEDILRRAKIGFRSIRVARKDVGMVAYAHVVKRPSAAYPEPGYQLLEMLKSVAPRFTVFDVYRRRDHDPRRLHA